MNRRTFLTSSLAGLAFAGLPPRVFAATPEGSKEAPLAELRRHLGDRLVTPADSTYEQIRKIRTRAFDAVRPMAIVEAQSVADVQVGVRWAAAHGVPIVARCGGHSYSGASTCDGLVVRLNRLASVVPDPKALTAEVGGGALLADVNFRLLSAGVGLPTGSCPSVGVGGLTLGGGIGFSSRHWGLLCDNLARVTLVLPSGEVVTADAQNEPDLFWACQGGGGGQLGVVTSFGFRVHPVEPISTYSLRWPWEAASTVLAAWQAWAPRAPDALFSMLSLTRGKDRPRIQSSGRFFGPKAQLEKILGPLLDAAVPEKGPSLADATLWSSHVKGPKCLPDPSACHSWNHPLPGRFQQSTHATKSDYFKAPLSSEGRATLIGWMERAQAQALSWGGVILDALGGAINRVPREATGFVHRDSLFQGEYTFHWGPKLDPDRAQANQEYVRAFYVAMRPFASGECYQNYADLDRVDWAQAYYAGNLPRLREIKRRYDPNGVFRGPQILTGSGP